MKKKILIILTMIVLLLMVGLALRSCPCFESFSSKDLIWAKQISEIKAILKETKDISTEGQLRPVQIVREVDLTGDGISEALVTTGSGGAYSDDLVLFVWKGDSPALAKFINALGEESSIIFSEGASVRNGASVNWKPEQRIIYSSSWNIDFNGALADCEVNAYQYDDNQLAFVYQEDLSATIGLEFCAVLQQSL
ncbi:MAG: hypothetical protein WCX70_00495 [Candidatus Paceibacterota bacterium]|jgi:hypothetical protein